MPLIFIAEKEQKCISIVMLQAKTLYRIRIFLVHLLSIGKGKEALWAEMTSHLVNIFAQKDHGLLNGQIGAEAKQKTLTEEKWLCIDSRVI